MSNTRLRHIRVAGFLSLRDVSLDLTPVTVLIGPNGAGKSNLLSALALLERCAAGFLPLFVGLRGGASFLLNHGGAERRIAIDVELADEAGRWAYSIVLLPTASDALAFEVERVGHAPEGADFVWTDLGQGHTESILARRDTDPTVKHVRGLLASVCAYHFHDTSPTSELRSNARDADDRRLAAHGGNLATLWLRWKESDDIRAQQRVRSIEDALRMVVPGVARLEPVALPGHAVRLDWIDDQGQRLHVANLSDGSLRLLALLTALAQPDSMRPEVIVIDEPEIGLHPAALDLFCEWMRSAATHTQILVATQSPAILGHVTADEVIIVERRDGSTNLVRKSESELAGWLEDYGLDDLYAMNVLGGRP